MTFFGLPLHPLVVHAAVVLLPLAALGAVVIAVSARARARFGWLVVATAAGALAAVAGSRVSGEALAGGTTGTGVLGTHMAWGLLAPWPAAAVLVTTVLVVATGKAGRGWRVSTGALAIVAALAALAVIGVVGHSGATSVWGSGA